VHDRSRLVEALIELGCVYRDWARLRPLYDRETTDPDRDAIALDAEAALRRAIREAETEKELSHRAVQAQVNLAWLYHYVGQDDRASAELRRAIAHVGPEYLITQHSGLPKRDLPVSYFWVQLGKAHLLLGEIAMAEYRSITHLDKLTEAARMYTLSLAYDRLYAPDFRDMRRGKDRIYDNFKTLKAEEFPAVYKSVSDTEQAFRMQSPSLMSSFLLESFGDLNAMSGAVR